MRLSLFSFLLFLFSSSFAQDTFSIVAVDPATGEVGSAGATCLDTNIEGVSAIIISDVLPGKGAIHTQSFWNATNQQRARLRMEEGFSPQAIMDYLVENDIQNNPAIRQYGAADFDDNGLPRAAAYTGPNCFDAKDHRVGENYAVQGNILLDNWILDSMEARFLNTAGSLAEKLMAAMQAANVPGADSRCLNEGVSSRSAFIRVARPDDEADNLFLDINVGATPFGVEPIDELQSQFDAWLLSSTKEPTTTLSLEVFPNPAVDEIVIQWDGISEVQIQILDINGQLCFVKNTIERKFRLRKNDLCESNILIIKMSDTQGQLIAVKKLIIN
ncbi:MAG: DUF1028 domain-containing protein [Saprospiraceae bacterium]|nr:DUF1028 domain-containing protein [Saprospiraceae bacterium]